jgi:hypothetical protein
VLALDNVTVQAMDCVLLLAKLLFTTSELVVLPALTPLIVQACELMDIPACKFEIVAVTVVELLPEQMI